MKRCGYCGSTMIYEADGDWVCFLCSRTLVYKPHTYAVDLAAMQAERAPSPDQPRQCAGPCKEVLVPERFSWRAGDRDHRERRTVCKRCEQSARQKGIPKIRPVIPTARCCAGCGKTLSISEFRQYSRLRWALRCKSCNKGAAMQRRADAGELYQQQAAVKRMRNPRTSQGPRLAASA